jgi:hypothetical protein
LCAVTGGVEGASMSGFTDGCMEGEGSRKGREVLLVLFTTMLLMWCYDIRWGFVNFLKTLERKRPSLLTVLLAIYNKK